MHTANINGTVFPPEHIGLGRKDPSPETEAEWQFFESIRSHIITKEDVIKLGKDPKKVGKFEDDYVRDGLYSLASTDVRSGDLEMTHILARWML